MSNSSLASSSSSQQVKLDNPYGKLHLGSNQNSAGFVTFDIGSDYQVLEAIGTGTYGVVCSAICCKTGWLLQLEISQPCRQELPQ